MEIHSSDPAPETPTSINRKLSTSTSATRTMEWQPLLLKYFHPVLAGHFMHTCFPIQCANGAMEVPLTAELLPHLCPLLLCARRLHDSQHVFGYNCLAGVADNGRNGIVGHLELILHSHMAVTCGQIL